MNLSQTRVYYRARKMGLPHNKRLTPGGLKEQQIMAMVGAGYDDDQVCAAFSIAPIVLKRIRKRFKIKTT